ncbi:MAG TPA: SHOCT domain-containing protein [Candidatus Nanoarchaeia archaeon]|nr:SHOCT domain-containing protein [Candidatus Nanoarchaeia archaeon]
MEDSMNLWILIVAAVVLLFFLGSFGMGGYGMMGLGMGFGFLFMLLFWGIIIGVIVAAVRSTRSDSSKRHIDSLEILKKRYARGDINKKEFEKRKKDLYEIT